MKQMRELLQKKKNKRKDLLIRHKDVSSSQSKEGNYCPFLTSMDKSDSFLKVFQKREINQTNTPSKMHNIIVLNTQNVYRIVLKKER